MCHVFSDEKYQLFQITYHLFFAIYFYRPAPKSKEDQILEQIQKCTKAVNNNVIEHTAYIRGSAAKNDIDLDKFKDQVCAEMEKDAGACKSDAETGMYFALHDMQ